MGSRAMKALGILLLWPAALAAQATASQPAVSEPSWQQAVVVLVGAIFTLFGSWIAALVVRVLGNVAERAGHRLTTEQEETLHGFVEVAVRAAEEAAASRGLKKAGERKFGEVLGAAQKRFPALDDDTIKRAINAATNRINGLGASGVTGKP